MATTTTKLEVKLASIAVHAEELIKELRSGQTDWNAAQFDIEAILGLLQDGEVKALLLDLGQAALLPAKRR